MNNIISPTELWKNYDPQQLPLDVNILGTTCSPRYQITDMYFTGSKIDGCSVRVYGAIVQSCVNQQRYSPSLLFVNSPDKSVDLRELEFWADKGYIAMSIDYSGDSNNGKHTIYPEQLSYAKYGNSKDYYVATTPQDTKWHEYAVSTMRAVTYLRARDDISSLSILSVGSGSNIAIMVLGIDKRVDNGAIIFGNLYQDSEIDAEQSQDNHNYEDVVEADSSQIDELILMSEQQQKWEALSPQSYLPLIKAPIYVVASGNSATTDVITLSDTYVRTNDNSRLLIVPNSYDSVNSEVVNGIDKWLSGTTVSEDIELSYSNVEGRLVVSANTGIEKDKLEFWYCRNGSSKGKHWRQTNLESTDIVNKYNAVIDLYSHNCTILILVVYRDDITISSTIMQINTDSGYKLQHPASLMYDGNELFHFVDFSNYNGWHHDGKGIINKTGYLDISGAEGRIMGTFASQDDSIKYQDTDAITLDICCNTKQELTIMAVSNYMTPKQVKYSCKVVLVGDGKWQRIMMDRRMFVRTSDGHSMPADASVDLFVFVAKDRFLISNVCLV